MSSIISSLVGISYHSFIFITDAFFTLLNALQNGVLLKIIRHVIKSDHNISQKYSETKRTKWKMLQIMKTDKKRKKQLSCWRTNKSLEIEGVISLLLIEVEVSLVHCLKLVYSVRVLCSKSFLLLCLCVCLYFCLVFIHNLLLQIFVQYWCRIIILCSSRA